jgi:hypothetical protein
MKIDEKDEKVTNANVFQGAHNFVLSVEIEVVCVNKGKTDWSELMFKTFAFYMKR